MPAIQLKTTCLCSIRQQKRSVRATKAQSEEVKTLLQLMGVPVVDAPCEAEASVRECVRMGSVVVKVM